MPAPRRLLITGSRDWDDTEAIKRELDAAWMAGFNVLVSGACPTGADRLCEQWWEYRGLEVERYPAMWRKDGIYNRAAGFERNAEMVRLGAEACVAFIKNDSKGASHTAKLAEDAGIPTLRVLG